MLGTKRERLVVAVGGNAIHPGNITGTVEEQLALASRTGDALLPLIEDDNELIITHGNGPVVGKILMRQALSRDRIAPVSPNVCVAHSQGGIAYMLMQALENPLRRAGNPRHVVCLGTQVEIDGADAAFDNPAKPVGCIFDADQAQAVAAEFGWLMREEAPGEFRHHATLSRPRNHF